MIARSGIQVADALEYAHKQGALHRDTNWQICYSRDFIASWRHVGGQHTFALANLILDRLTSPSEAALRAERQLRLQDAMNGIDPVNREFLALRYFEKLSNSDVATVLGLTKSAASNRYIRALKRLKDIIREL